MPGFELSSWLGFFGPANLPPPVVERLSGALVKALNAPDVVARLNAAGLLPVGNAPAQFAAQQKADYEQRGALIKAIGISRSELAPPSVTYASWLLLDERLLPFRLDRGQQDDPQQHRRGGQQAR